MPGLDRWVGGWVGGVHCLPWMGGWVGGWVVYLALVGIQDSKGGFICPVKKSHGEKVAFLQADGEGFLGLALWGEGEDFEGALWCR